MRQGWIFTHFVLKQAADNLGFLPGSGESSALLRLSHCSFLLRPPAFAPTGAPSSEHKPTQHGNVFQHFPFRRILWWGGRPRADRGIESRFPEVTPHHLNLHSRLGHGDPRGIPGEDPKALQTATAAPEGCLVLPLPHPYSIQRKAGNTRPPCLGAGQREGSYFQS